jgi:hypothetical protein
VAPVDTRGQRVFSFALTEIIGVQRLELKA